MKPIIAGAPHKAIEPHISRSIDIIRGAAALGVIWGHSMYGVPPLKLNVYGLSFPVELNGGVWVWIFLSVSGYLVGRGFAPGGYELSARGFARFFLNRALRILPLAYVALLICLAACLISGGGIPEDIARQFLFVPRRNNMSLVGALWTVAAEMQFYLMAIILVPLVYRVWLMGGVFPGALLFVVAVYSGVYAVGYLGDNLLQPRTFFGNIAFFVFGLLLARINVMNLHAARQYKLFFVVSLIILVWWLQNYKPAYFWGWGQHKWPLGGSMMISLIIVAITLLISPRLEPETRRNGRGYLLRSLGWCGFYCYGIYVWHAVLVTLDRFFWHIPLGLPKLGLLLLAIPMALLSYELIEKPILCFKVSHR